MSEAAKRIEKAEKYVQRGKLEDALTEYLYAFKEDPSNDALVEIIAELYLKQNQQPKAMECYSYLFDKRVEQKNGPAAVLMYRKMARLGLHDPARMLICADFQAKQKPAEARDYYRQSAQMFLDAGNKPQALAALRGLTQIEQNNAEVHCRVGVLAEGLGQSDVAAQSFFRAGELLRAAAAADGSSTEQAIALLERAHTLAPGDAAVATALATVLFAAGQPGRTAELLGPFAAENVPERNRLLADALLAIGNLTGAEGLFWKLPATMPDAQAQLWLVLDRYLGADGTPRDIDAAIDLLRRLKQAHFSSRKEEEYIVRVEGLHEKKIAGIEVLEFLAALYSEMNRLSDLGGTLARIFDLHMETGDYPGASATIERLSDVDPSDPKSGERIQALLGRLREKLDGDAYRTLEARVTHTGEPGEGAPGGPPAGGSLEEMILQAEMLLQFGSKEAAVDYMKGILQAFPGEENKNEQLRNLYVEGGLVAKLAPPPPPAPVQTSMSLSGAIPRYEPSPEEGGANIGQVSEITRLIYRQGTIKGVLSVCVNEIGKAWGASRCVVGLCTPGKPPTAALEYCAPGIKQSDVASIVKLVTTMVQLAGDGNPLPAEDVTTEPRLAELAPVLKALGIRSLLALPLLDADQPTGVVVLEQCDRLRPWRPNEVFVAKTIVDQMGIAMSNVKLRSLVKAVADERSGLLNRSSYVDCLVSETSRARKQNTPLSAVLLRFASGTEAVREFGEKNLQKFMQDAAQVLLGQLRENDIGVRYDSATLAMVLPDTRGKDLGLVIERIRKAMGAVRAGDREGPPFIAGMAEAVIDGDVDPVDTVTELINRLEDALEAAARESVTAKLLAPAVAGR